jgi:trehalose synthase
MDGYAPIVGEERMVELRAAAETTERALGGRSVWNVNSTAAGGGVAELLSVLLPYVRGFGVDARWLVMEGDPGFFAVTKRLCNGLYGVGGDGGPLGSREHEHFRSVSRANAAGLFERVRPQDIVILHDPQTAGLVASACSVGATVVWRCHVGRDEPNEHTGRCWRFLRPYLLEADAFVFSTQRHVPGWVDPRKAHVVPPSVDPFSAKNREMDQTTVRGVLRAIGLLDGDSGPGPATAVGSDGSTVRIERAAEVVRSGPPVPADAPLVVQVSRWDRLKDMSGVMLAFTEHVAHEAAHLALVGPEVRGVADDLEAARMLEECRALWEGLAAHRRDRVHLVCLPMADLEENAAMVNAVQRHAAVVAQKSLAEGFGLTVTEAMWKGASVVASTVGGIADQIEHGESGLLVRDPTDLGAFATAVDSLLSDPDLAGKLGRAARARASDRFLGDRHLLRYAQLFARIDDARRLAKGR